MIDVKIVFQNGKVETKQINADPSDVEIIDALGGNAANEDVRSLGSLIGWDVIYVEGRNEKMIIGSAPYFNTENPERISCGLSDEKAVKLVKFLDDGGKPFVY